MLFKRLYLDANASYRLLPEVKAAIPDLIERIGNPSSIHKNGQEARILIEEARTKLRKLLGLNREDRLIFTSGATESNNHAIFAAFAGIKELAESSAITTAVEHPSVLEPLSSLKERGLTLREIPVLPSGALDTGNLFEYLDSSVRFISIMGANNESGAVFPVAEMMSQLKAKPHSIFLTHCDATQLLGKSAFDFQQLAVDLASFSGHKIGALPGVGALVVRAGVQIPSMLKGGPQETHSRAGTENVLGIVSFGIAAAALLEQGDRISRSMMRSRSRFESALLSAVPDAEIIAGDAERLPNTSTVRIPGVTGDDMVVALDLKGISVSSGAACASGKPTPSHVLMAMGYTEQQARECIRLSFPADVTESEVSAVAECIAEAVSRRVRR